METIEQRIGDITSRGLAEMQRESAALALILAAVAFALGGVAGWTAHLLWVAR